MLQSVGPATVSDAVQFRSRTSSAPSKGSIEAARRSFPD
jgi:hypothetical protein